MPRAAKDQPHVALVTGGASVRRAIVERLVEAGFDVAFTYRHSEREAKELVAIVRRRKRRAVAIRADLSQAAVPALVAERFRAAFGRLDVLVNNASTYEISSLDETSAEQLARQYALHVIAPALLCRELRSMLAKSRGHVVNMVDLLAEKPWPKYLGHCASKAGLLNLTMSLARELGPEVTVNGIAPGIVEWPEHYPEREKEKYLKRVPLARAGTPQDVARLVHFLCTDATYITGQIIRLDGGRSIT